MSAKSAPEAEARETPAKASDGEFVVEVDGYNDDDHADDGNGSDLPTSDRDSPCIKAEDELFNSDATATTLRPAPQPSAKRREFEASATTPEPIARLTKKRKRGLSPPWQFPTADNTTLKTADGRRASARVNPSTPTLSEPEDRSRSVTQPPMRSRPPSPPWKKFAAEGPTSVSVDGIRKSGRVNKELAETPKRTSPRSRKQVDRRLNGYSEDKKTLQSAKGSVGSARAKFGKSHQASPNRSRNSSTNTKIAVLQAQIAALRPSRSFPALSRRREDGSHTHDGAQVLAKQEPAEPSSPPTRRKSRRLSMVSPSSEMGRPAPKIKLRLNTPRHAVPPPHPQAMPPSTPRPPQLSLYQRMDKYDLLEAQQPFTENDRDAPDAEIFMQRAVKQAVEEGGMRQRLLKESHPGGALSRDRLVLFQDDPQPEPPPQYGHHDHLVAHALYLRQLQIREKTHHRLMAKKLAHEAVEYWRGMHGPTEEDLVAEQTKILELIKKQVIVDMKAKWDMVEAHVREAKRVKWEAEQDAIRARRLQKQLEWSENLLAKQRGEADSDGDLDEDSTGDIVDTDASNSSDDVEENMSDSEEESDISGADEEGEMGADALAAYLAQRQDELVHEANGEDEESVQREEDGKSDRHSESPDETESADEVVINEDSSQNIFNKPFESHQGDSLADPGEVQVEHTDTRSHLRPPETALAQISRRHNKRGQEDLEQLSKEEMEVDNHLSSDESTDMDSEDYDSDEDMGSTDDEDDGTSGEDRRSDDGSEVSAEEDPSAFKTSLLGFYSSKDLLREKDGGLPTPNTSVENGGDNDHPRSGSEAVSEGQDGKSDHHAHANHNLPKEKGSDSTLVKDEVQDHTRITPPSPAGPPSDQTVTDDVASIVDVIKEESAVEKSTVNAPTLLRGQLRSYQLAGLNWLASLYRNGTNGILADEMGLGKTIQTISLLAHLAEEHDVWEPHLVIVPTSVILNWVTEFQKFLPGFRVLGYYGSIEERHQKRRGWANDPHHDNKALRGYNVIITSYNVAMQDINAIRNVQWHYLILDEAHNIRNFQSQRWQTLIRLRTRARLLLTGTPLQNNLSEVWALLTFLTAGDDDRSHGELEEFLGHWKDPVKEIFDQGVQTLSSAAQKVVEQLHVSLRPFLLRRKKIEVEKDLPKKTESVVVCKLSKRQRQLYQEYMGLAETRAKLAKGSGIQAGAVLLSLRRVCNHPDLFDPRSIQTSFAMERSPLEGFSVKESLIRSLLGIREAEPDMLLLTKNEERQRKTLQRSRKLAAYGQLHRQVQHLESLPLDVNADASTILGSRMLQRVRLRERKLGAIRASIQATHTALRDSPIYGSDLREVITIPRGRAYYSNPKQQSPLKALKGWPILGHRPLKLDNEGDISLIQTSRIQREICSLDTYATGMYDKVIRFAFVPPPVTASVLQYAISPKIQQRLRSSLAYPAESDYAHEARVRLSIAFPDSRLLIYDSGKLQRLTHLLRELQAKGSRSLIFTQMTGTLNILEQFLNLLNLPYLRLDGSTPVERRQIYSAEFNRPDSKYQCMILSSRAGGVGLNLTGASSVIFFDLDWNPQMDRQCMDRAHRIGQVRDVEVYKMVSEKTVEENILRRANQKSLLDQTVIQEGQFTTEYRRSGASQLVRGREEEALDDEDVSAAIERFLGGGEQTTTQALESVEEAEDVHAAQQARKEDHQDDIDFARESSHRPGPTGSEQPPEETGVEEDRKGHVDLYMIRLMQHLFKDTVYVPPPVAKIGKDAGKRAKRKR